MSGSEPMYHHPQGGYAMCFEFEYLYWAKLEEEARQRKEQEQRRQQAAQPPQEAAPRPQQQDPVPA
jgi:hypothetical protein